MTKMEHLIAENARLERENKTLRESNFILSRLFYHAAQKLHSYRVPLKYAEPSGRVTFTRSGESVIITYVDNLDYISETGDPVLDEIMMSRKQRKEW